MIKKISLVITLVEIFAGFVHADKPVYVAGNLNGHAYELIPTPTPWHLAKKKADEQGGYLVVITSAQENEFITELVKKSTNGEYCQVWIGLNDEKNEGDWRWINGEKYTFNNWHKTNPDNNNGEENTVEIIKIDDKFVWNDRPSDHRSAYIIEYNHEINLDVKNTSNTAKSSLRSTK